MTPADKLAEAVEAMLGTTPWADVLPQLSRNDGGPRPTPIHTTDNAIMAVIHALTAYRAAKDEAYQVTIHGQYDAASHCVLTSHGETLVVFDTDEGSFAPLDGKQVSVTVRGNQ